MIRIRMVQVTQNTLSYMHYLSIYENKKKYFRTKCLSNYKHCFDNMIVHGQDQ